MSTDKGWRKITAANVHAYLAFMHTDASPLTNHANDKRMNLRNTDTNKPTPLTVTWDFSHLQGVDLCTVLQQ